MTRACVVFVAHYGDIGLVAFAMSMHPVSITWDGRKYVVHLKSQARIPKHYETPKSHREPRQCSDCGCDMRQCVCRAGEWGE